MLVVSIPKPQRRALPGRSPGRGLLILRCESHPPFMCRFGSWFGLWDVRPFKINVMKSVEKQLEIIKKINEKNQEYGKDGEKTSQPKETRTETYIKGSRIHIIH